MKVTGIRVDNNIKEKALKKSREKLGIKGFCTLVNYLIRKFLKEK
jgi:hypothetical protein